MARAKLTNSSDESELSGLLSGDSAYEIPYFQRPYKWKSDRLRKLEQDLLTIVDGSSDSHFLGAIIMHGRRSNPSDPTSYELIDGQQRLTTVFLYICAAVKTLCRVGEHDEALGLFQKYIALGRKTSLISNVKLHSCGEDRQQMNEVMSDLTSDVVFRSKLGTFSPLPLPSTGKPSGTLLKNYRSACKFMEAQYREAGTERVRSLYNALLEKVSVVQIDVWDPTNGPKIFDSLNSSQEPMTIGDLVRNDVFSRLAGSAPKEIEVIDAHKWQPFYKKFQVADRNYFEGYFFPFGLIHNANLSKSNAYSFLKERWKHFEDPSAVIADLTVYQNAFLDLVTGSNSQGHPPALAKHVRRMWEIKAPASAYPFLMKLSEAARVGEISAENAIEVLALVEAFLVRRAISGFEPTGLHAVFKSLWSDIEGEVTRRSVVRAIRSHKTVVWPTNEQVSEAVKARELYGSGIVKYVLKEFDASLGGDSPSDIPWVEHVLPQSLSAAWREHFTDTSHRQWLHTLANLIPLSEQMNRELSNKPFIDKRKAFLDDSMFKSARAFAQAYEEWTPKRLDQRARDLAVWANTRWPDA